MRLIQLAATIAAAMLAVSACSSQADTGSAATTPTPPPVTTVPGIPGISSTPGIPGNAPTLDADLRYAVQSYSDAYLTGDVETAYGYLSPRCQTVFGHDGFATDVQTAATTYGAPLAFQVYKASEVGDAAYVTYTYETAPEINENGQLWSRLDGSWLFDAC
jgi:hypothetical protein